MLKGETPGGEGLGDEIDAADGEEPIQAAQHPFFRCILAAQRSLSVR